MKHYGIAICLITTTLYASACNGSEPNFTVGSGVAASGNLENGSESPPPDPKQTCNADKVQWAIGLEATDEVIERARKEAGAKIVRVLQPGLAVTQEFMYGRLNMDVDKTNVITSASCW